ncbi:MAG TPA: YhfZ family protein [Candidatus Dormibacteraeota bacterium]|nr:YhfZ family protein [Candidatus Dormibacteraeota bacterium]
MTTLELRRAHLRNDELRALLAAYLVEAPIGGRIPTVRELGAQFGASIGAIQRSLTRLVEAGAVDVDSRRGQGTVLSGRSLGGLWSAARNEPLVVALPLPISRQIQGLATGIKAALADAGIETYLTFSRGSRRRLQALEDGRCHVVVMSILGAAEACGPRESVVLELPPGTHASGHMVFERPRSDGRPGPLRVGLDRDSVDLQRMTELEYAGSQVEFVPATYMQFGELFRSHAVDAAVWDVDEVPPHLPADVIRRPFSATAQAALADGNTRSTVVVRRDDSLTAAIVHQCLGSERVLEVQQAVVAGERLPEY